MHLSQLVDAASSAVTQVNVSLQQAKMNIASSAEFSPEQKQTIFAMLEPTEQSISNASKSFIVSEE